MTNLSIGESAGRRSIIDLISSGEFSPAADINMDGVVNLLDVGPFIALLSS